MSAKINWRRLWQKYDHWEATRGKYFVDNLGMCGKRIISAEVNRELKRIGSTWRKK